MKMTLPKLQEIVANDPMFIERLLDVLKSHPSSLATEFLLGTRYNVETRLALPQRCTINDITYQICAVKILNAEDEVVSYRKAVHSRLSDRVRYDRINTCSIREWEKMCRIGQ